MRLTWSDLAIRACARCCVVLALSLRRRFDCVFCRCGAVACGNERIQWQFDHKGPQVFQIDPSGSYFEWKATAIGKGFVNAKTFLEKRHHDDMELEDAIHTAILTLKDSFEGEMTSTNVELIRVTDEGKVVHFTKEEVQDYLDEAE